MFIGTYATQKSNDIYNEYYVNQPKTTRGWRMRRRGMALLGFRVRIRY